MTERTGKRELEWGVEQAAGAEGKMRRLFEGNLLPLVVWHQDGRIRDANEAYLKLVKYSRQSIWDGTLRWDRLTPAEYLARDQQAIQELLDGKTVCTPFQKEYICQDGGRIPVVVGGALFPNRQDRGIAFALDLKKYPSTEEALSACKDIIRDLYSSVFGTERALELERPNEAVDTPGTLEVPEPSAMLAHEISQPLGTILANAQSAQRLLRQRTPNLQELKAIMNDIIAEDRRASQLIDQVRFSVLRHKRTLRLVNINLVVSEVLRGLRNRLAKSAIVDEIELAPELPMVRGDRGQLHQLFINLFSNASEALDETGLAFRTLSIRTYRQSPISVSIEVRDTGSGIPPDKLEAIFQPFFSSKVGGMGIGLYICRAIVRFHGGRIWATNHPSGGAAFHVSLPAVTP
jgi:PAS domain S-box-containing protein